MSSNNDWLVAIDAGGTRSVCRAFDRSGRERGRGEGPAANPQNGGVPQSRDAIARAIDAALSAERPTLVGVSAGVAGVAFDAGSRRALETSLAERFGVPCWIVGDLDIAHTAALGTRPGTVAIAGTGSVVVGTNARGERHVAGGHGPLVGDAGSAYSIARAGVRAAALCEDEAGPQTALLAAARDHWRVENRVASALAGRPVHEIAAFAPVVARCADAGDERARAILNQAGNELGELAGRVALRVGAHGGEPAFVSFQGTVLRRNELVRAAFGAALASTAPQAELREPLHEPVVGAYLRGCQQLGWPVSSAATVV